jgi:hypothetical protein
MSWLTWQCRLGFEKVAARRMKFVFFKDGDGEHLYTSVERSVELEFFLVESDQGIGGAPNLRLDCFLRG